MKRLPVGKQVYRQLITGNFLYVDKTRFLVELADSEIPTFLSRPRRFGKSLTVSTFKEMFLGNKDLFKGTYAYENWDFNRKSNVIKLDMSSIDVKTTDRFEATLLLALKKVAAEYEVNIDEELIPSALFQELIIKLSGENGVVVLIDEYDSPLLKKLYKPELKEVKDALSGFYSQLKANEEYIRFVFLTGITKFSKVGVFSALNNLSDITLKKRYSTICGYTKDEISDYLSGYIEAAKEELNLDDNTFWDKLKSYYNGYSWDGKNFLFNPFSILNFFDDNEFRPYWMESGSPSFIIDYFKTNKLDIGELSNISVLQESLSNVDIEDATPESFLMQAGYLTIKDIKKSGRIILDFPNYEVKQTLGRHLLRSNYSVKDGDVLDVIDNMSAALDNDDTLSFLGQLKVILSSVTHHHYDANKNEYFYSALLLMFLQAAGFNVTPEKTTNRGRIDLILTYKGRAYIMELKMDSAKNALKQIKEKNYQGQYKNYRCTFIGLAIDYGQRNITAWEYEEV